MAFGSDLSNPDPLGIGLRSRGAAHRDEFKRRGTQDAMQHGQLVSFGQLGPIGDPMWDAFFQARDEAGVKRIAGAPGLPNAPTMTTIDYDTPETDSLRALNTLVGVPDEIGVNVQKSRAPKRAAPIQSQRGTSGNNQTQRAVRPQPPRR